MKKKNYKTLGELNIITAIYLNNNYLLFTINFLYLMSLRFYFCLLYNNVLVSIFVW